MTNETQRRRALYLPNRFVCLQMGFTDTIQQRIICKYLPAGTMWSLLLELTVTDVLLTLIGELSVRFLRKHVFVYKRCALRNGEGRLSRTHGPKRGRRKQNRHGK